MAVDNLLAGLAGEPMPNSVNGDAAGYSPSTLMIIRFGRPPSNSQ